MNQNQPVEILLVEDNPNDVELALHAFRKQNLTNQIFTVRDGEEALDFIFCTGAFKQRSSQKAPKVILLDLKLPKISGLEVLKRIKSHQDTKTIPIVILTTSQEDRDVIESYKLGVNSYIIKPVDFTQFSESMRQIGLYWLLLNHLPSKTL
ncbi:MAG: response regulator receiver protein [uncultured bacterium]|nr:MAG: response regulator receiver protein [uncultured bacterium]